MSTTTTTETTVFDQEKATPRGAAPAAPAEDPARRAYEAARATGRYRPSLPVEQILPHAGNVRTEVGDTSELADSIRAKGILQPLLVAPHPDREGDFVLLAGHRRLAAAKAVGLMTVPATIRDDLTDPAAQLEVMLSENLQRTDLTVMEEATAYQTLLEFPGYSVESIARKTGRSASTVRRRLDLTRTPQQVQEGVVSGDVPLERALTIARIEDDPEAAEQMAKIAAAAEWQWKTESDRILKAAAWRKDAPVLVEWLKDLGEEPQVEDCQAYGIADVWKRAGEPEWRLHNTTDAPAVVDGKVQPTEDDVETLREQIEAGLVPVLCNMVGRIAWMEPVAQPDEDEVEEKTAAAARERAARDVEASRLADALRVQRTQAEQTLRKKLSTPGALKGTAKQALVLTLLNEPAYVVQQLLAPLEKDLEIPSQGYVTAELAGEVFDVLMRLTLDQLVLLMVMQKTGIAKPDALAFQLPARSAGNWAYPSALRHRAALEVYGLEETSLDREVADYWAPTLPDTGNDGAGE